MTNKLNFTFLLIPLLLCSFSIVDKHRINIVFIGDSITAGGGNPAGIAPPRFAGEYLRKQPAFEQVQVANEGHSGFTTVNFLPGTQTFAGVKAAAAPFYADKTATLIFSIMIGTNDSAVKGPLGSPVSPDNYRRNLKLIIDSLFAAFPKAKIVINYPIWYSENTHNTSTYMKEGLLRLNSYKKEIDALVAGYQKDKPQRLFTGDKAAYDYFKAHAQTDFNHETGPYGEFYLHPNEKGDKVLATYWAKAIMRILQ